MQAAERFPEAQDLALDDFDVSEPGLFETDQVHDYFARLRDEAPVHYCPQSIYGPYWSVTRYADIVAVESQPELFSSSGAVGGHMLNYNRLFDPNDDFQLPMFIAMDDPDHAVARKTVTPMVAPANLAAMQDDIRARVVGILDALPVGETFDWVERVSVELTTQVLATLFDFPFEERSKLTYWSDLTMQESDDAGEMQQRKQQLLECAEAFIQLWQQRQAQSPKLDLISMLAHGAQTRDMPPAEYLGNTLLLIVGGNDTTRNSLSAGVLALNQFPGEYDKLRANPQLISSMVPEIIRWQTPLAHMARTATADCELGGQKIRAGERVAMWYMSGNRDPRHIESPDDFIIDRQRPREHLSFGFGVHRCLGNRLAELQLRIAWEEIMKRFSRVEVVGEPRRTRSCIIHGYTELPVRLHAR